jgi:cell division protein FtsW (lipid II flippase)
MRGAPGRLLRNLPSLAVLLVLVVGIGLHSVIGQPPQSLRLSVVSHYATIPGPGRVLLLGRGQEADLRLLDPLVDAGIHAEIQDGLLVNRSSTQRLLADGVELTETSLLAGDRLMLHVPASLPTGASLRAIGRVAAASPGAGTRPIEVEVTGSSFWDRLRNGQVLARSTVLRQQGTDREAPLDRLDAYGVSEGLLLPGLCGFELERPDGGRRRLADGEVLLLGSRPADRWTVRLRIEPPRRLLGRWPALLVRDAEVERRYEFGDRPLELGRWGRLDWSGSHLGYRDLGKRAALEIVRGDSRLNPGRARVRSGSVLKLGHTRYRLILDADALRLEIQPRGQGDRFADLSAFGLRLGDLLPRHYDTEIPLRDGRTCLTSGAACEPGEDAFTLIGGSQWGRESFVLLDLDGGSLLAHAIGSLPVLLRRAAGPEGRHLIRRGELRTPDDLERYERGESLEVGDRLEVAGLGLELRRPDHRPLTASVATVLGGLLIGVAVVFFAFHRPRPLRFAGATRTVYDLDPTSTRVRAIGQRVILPPLPIPNLLLPAGAGLTMAGMMLQLRFWLDPRLLGSADFFFRQCGALAVGLGLFLFLGLRRPRPASENGSILPVLGDPLGIDRHIWLGMLFLLLTNLLTAVGIGSRHNGFFFRIPGLGLTVQFSAFAKLFFAIGFARLFAHGLQIARGGDRLCYEVHQISLSRALHPARKGGRGMETRALLYAARKVFFLALLLGVIFSFYIMQNDLGPGLIFTLSLALFVGFVMGQYNRGLRGFLRFLGPQAFLPLGLAAMIGVWLLLPGELALPDSSVGHLVAPVLDKVLERLNLWWEPWRFTKGEQLVQSLWTVSGTSRELSYFSNLHSDFAFSAAVHHYGGLGGLLLLGAFVLLFGSGLMLARALFRAAEEARAPELYERSFTVVFASVVLIVEAAIHVGACLNFSPLTGVTLPFVSSGGSSLIVSWALLGLIGSRLAADRVGSAPRPASGRPNTEA